MGDVTPCRKCGLALSEPTAKVPLDGAVWVCHADCWPVVAAVERERDAYRKAKAENDDRFQIEAGEQRERASKAEQALAAERALRQDAEVAADELRHALICQCRDNAAMRKGELCWCATTFDVARYGHSIACAAAKDALAAFVPGCGLRLRRLEAVAAATEKVNRECGACGRVGFVPREDGVGPCPECADLVDAVIALAKPEEE